MGCRETANLPPIGTASSRCSFLAPTCVLSRFHLACTRAMTHSRSSHRQRLVVHVCLGECMEPGIWRALRRSKNSTSVHVLTHSKLTSPILLHRRGDCMTGPRHKHLAQSNLVNLETFQRFPTPIYLACRIFSLHVLLLDLRMLKHT